jgi:hypothetical protein
MRKYIWTALLALTFVALAGLVHAHGGLVGSHVPASSATASPENSPSCPLQWLMNYCCPGN